LLLLLNDVYNIAEKQQILIAQTLVRHNCELNLRPTTLEASTLTIATIDVVYKYIKIICLFVDKKWKLTENVSYSINYLVNV